MIFLQPGHGEAFKRDWHRAIKWLAFGAAVYNGGAWIVRRESHLGVNAVLYGLLFALEHEHVTHHEQLVRRNRTSAQS